jgi:hypothetical protein
MVERALGLQTTTGHRGGRAFSQLVMARALRALGRSGDTHHDQALSLYKEIGVRPPPLAARAVTPVLAARAA